MSRKKKLLLVVALTFTLVVLGALCAVLYLQAKPQSQFAEFLERQGVPVETILDQPQITAVGQKLEGLIPGFKVEARGPSQKVSPAVFDGISIKGVIGSSSETESTAFISADGETKSVRTGEEFSLRTPNGSVTLRCEEIRTDLVVLSVANSDLRKEFALH